MPIASTSVLLAGLVIGAADSADHIDISNSQRIPVPSRWQGRAGRFLEGQKVVVEFRANGEVRIAWESVGILFEAPTFDPSCSPPRMVLGASACGTYSFQGNRLKMSIFNLPVTVAIGGKRLQAAEMGIKLDLVRQKP